MTNIDSAIDSYLGERRQQTVDGLKLSVSNALGVNPDQEAQAKKAASALNIPIDTARENLVDAQQQVRMQQTDFGMLADRFPKTANYLTNQQNANLAHDDLDNMSNTEKVLGALKDIKGSAIAGAYSASRGAAGIFKAGFELAAPVMDPLAGTILPENPLRRVASGFDALGKSADAGAKANRPKSTGIIQGGINSGIESLSQNLMLLPLAFLPGGQSAYMSGMVAPAAGNAYSDAREKGIHPNQSAVYGASQGLIEYATEKLPVQYLVKDLKIGSPFYKVIAHQMATEIPGEQVATVLQDLNEWAVLNPEKPFSDYLAERPSAAAQTLIATVVGVGGQVSIAKGMQKLSDQFTGQSDQARQAESSAKLLIELNDLSAASKLRARDTELFQSFLQSALEDGPIDNVYVEPNQLMQVLEQSGIGLDEFAKTAPSVSDQLQKSLAGNTDISIPVAEFAARLVGQEYTRQLIEHLKTDPLGMSRAQAQEYIANHGENLKAEVERVLGGVADKQEFDASKDRVKQAILQNLNETTDWPALKNENDAELIATRTAVRAAQLGMTPEGLFQKHLLQVNSNSAEQSANGVVLNQKHHVELDASILGIAEENTKNLKKAAAQYAKKTFANTIVKNESDGQDIIISNQGIKHSASGTGSKLSALALTALDQVISRSKYTHSEQDNKNRNTIKEVRFYEATVNLGDEQAKLKIVVRVANDGSRYYDHYEIENPAGQSGKLTFKQDSLQPFTGLLSKEDIASLKRIEPKSNSYNQPARGQIAFGSDLEKSPSIITLLKSADLSTFLHESGHFFFESDIHLVAELNRKANESGIESMTDGEKQLMADVSKMLEWHGLQGQLNDQLNQWYTLSSEEKRSYHERTAESFERYLFEGKAPSIELQRIFRAFQSWLMNVYKSVQRFVDQNPEAGKLNDEMRQVFDRMLATNDQIELAEQGRSMMPLFSSANMAGMTEEEFAAYHNQDIESTLEARDNLQTRGLRDMQWLQNAKSKLIKKMQQEHKALRQEVMIDARREVLSQPIYRVYSFLTNRMTKDDKPISAALPKSDKSKVTTQVDSMLTAIAKLGGLRRDEITALMSIDPKMKNPMPAFGKHVFRNEGALSLDSIGELLAQYGYLTTDEHGKFDNRELEDKLDAEFRGDPQYSIEVDDRVLRGPDKAGLGIDIAALGAGRLDLGELKGEFTSEQIAQLEALKMVSKNGIAPDFVAEQFGISSGDELVRTLIAVPPPKEAINTLTDQMMLERYGDINSPEALSKAADEAIHNDARARFIATELNAINKAAGKPSVLISAAKDFAQTMVDRLIIRNLRPGQYSASEARAAKAAEKAMRDGNLEVAAAEKRNQVINNYATKAVYSAQKEVAQIRKFFSKVLGGKDEDMAKYRDMDYVNAARAILNSLGYGGKATVAIDYLSRVKSYDPALHEMLISSVNAAQMVAKPIDDLTLEELRNIREEVDVLWHLSRRGKQMEIDGDLIDRQEAAEALSARMNEIGLPDNLPGVNSAITEKEVRQSRVQQFKAFLRRVESWVDLKDGMNKMGPFRKFIFIPIKEAANLYRQEKLEYITKFRDAFEGIAKTMKKEQVYAPELNYTFGKDSGGVAMNEVMHAILHRGNDSNFRKLLLGRGWAELRDDGTLDTTRWDAFEKRMQQEGKLTKAHYDFAQSIWDLMDQLKPGAQKAHRDAYGRYFAEVTATSFTNAFGTYRGGYVPAKVDGRIVKDMELKKLIEEGKDGMMFAFPSANKGFTKSRVEYNKPLILDLRTLAQHIDQVLLFTHMENPARDVAKLIGMSEVSDTLNQQDPEAINSMLTPWLTRSAKQLVTTPVAGAGGLMRLFTILRSRTSMAAMFANISNTAQQITGFTLAAVKVRPGALLSSSAQYISNPKQMSEDVAGLSMFMAHRMDNQASAMLGDIQEILLNPNLFEKSQEWVKKHTFFMQSAVDNVMGTIIWSAAYNEAVGEGYESDDAVKIADGVVRQTQGSSLPEDISRMETGNAFIRMFTLFAGYFNMQANLLGTEFAKIAQEIGMRKGMGRGFYVMLMGFAAPAIVAELIAQTFRGGPDDDDRDGEYLDDWLMSVLVYGPIRTATAFIPGGQLVNSAIAKFNHNPADDKMSITPVMNSLDAVASIPIDVWKASQGNANAQKIVRDVSTVIAVTVGLPVNIAARPIGYIAGMEQGKINPTSSIDLVRGLVTGTASPQSK